MSAGVVADNLSTWRKVMSVVLMEPSMASKKPDTLSVKLPRDVVESARIVAAYTGEPMMEMLGDILRPILAQKEREEVAKRTKPKGAK